MAAALPYLAVSVAGWHGEPWTEFRLGIGGVKEIGVGQGMPGFLYLEIKVGDDTGTEEKLIRFMVNPATAVFEVGTPVAAPEAAPAPTLYIPEGSQQAVRRPSV